MAVVRNPKSKKRVKVRERAMEWTSVSDYDETGAARAQPEVPNVIQTFRPRIALSALIALGFLFALLLAGGIGWCAGRSPGPRNQVSSAPVVLAVKKIARLSTVEIEVADVVRYEEVRTVAAVFDFPKAATLRLKGRVLGGFDLDEGLDVNVDEARRRILVTLPPPKILSVDAKLEWFDEKSGWMNPITAEDRTRWMAWSRGALARAAKDAGLDAKAEAHARELLEGAGTAFGYKVEVRIAPRGPQKAEPPA